MAKTKWVFQNAQLHTYNCDNHAVDILNLTCINHTPHVMLMYVQHQQLSMHTLDKIVAAKVDIYMCTLL